MKTQQLSESQVEHIKSVTDSVVDKSLADLLSEALSLLLNTYKQDKEDARRKLKKILQNTTF